MRKLCFNFYVLTFFLSLFSPVRAAAQSAAGDTQYQIGSIETVGNVSLTRSEILTRVRSRVGDLFDEATAEEDAKRIAELAGVAYCYYEKAVVDGKIRLTFVIGEKDIVRKIIFIGNRRYKAGKLRKKLDFKVGDYLDTIGAESGRRGLIEFYQKKGFPFVQITLDAEKLRKGEVIYAIDEGPRVKIRSMKFSGNRGIKTKSLKKVIKSKIRKWFILPSYYFEEKINEDVAKLQNAYYQRGFLDAGIRVEREFSADRSKVDITFVIDEGPVYTVESIALIGNVHFDEGTLRSALKLKQGQVYSERKADSDVKGLIKLYRENGFIDADVKHFRKFVPEAGPNLVKVEFEVIEGQRFRIGRINITGNEQTHDKVVRRVLDEYDFQPGQWYNADIARGDGSGELEKKIREMVLTESTTITPTGEVPGQRDAQVSIIEGQTGNIMLGAGVSTDAGLLGQLIYEERNFNIRDWPGSFGEFITGKAFRGAGQRLRIALEPGTEVSQYSISFTEPYLRNKPISLDVVASSWERDRESYEEGRLKGYVGFEKRYKNNWRRSIGFRLEEVDVGDLDTDAPQEIRDVKGGNVLAGINLGIGRDLTDDRFNPTKGYNFNISYEQVGGDHTFGILSGIYRRYKTIYEDLAERKTVLSTKLLGASVVGDAPPFEKFYGGGSGTYGIRGFEYRGVSTRGLQTNVARPKRKDPIGSDWIFLANAEVTVPLVSDNFAALFFVDSGAIDSGNYRAAVGTGIQILIPQWFGRVPMRFSIATPIMKDDEDDTEVFSFSVGRLF